MKIYTSYFANWRNIPGEAVAIGVTRFKPSYWQGANLESLAPSEELLREYRNRNIDEFMFKMRYLGELRERGLTPKFVKDELYNYSKGFDVVLCCYEAPKDFCHRHILAEWLGEDVKEL
jgi:uncharacterized protein YeaO (DUF488 family)